MGLPPTRFAAFQPPPGRRVRILVSCEGEPRGLLWFRLSKDGSLYFGPYYRSADSSSYKKVHTGGSGRTLTLNDLTQVTDPDLIRNTRTSIHPSGAISMSGKRFYREPMRHLQEQEEICKILFQHPSRFPVVRTRDSQTSDLCLIDAFDPQLPLQAVIYLAPYRQPRRIIVRDAPFQATFLFDFQGLQGVSDRSIHLIVYQSWNSRWPDGTYLLVPAGRRTLRARFRRALARLTTR